MSYHALVGPGQATGRVMRDLRILAVLVWRMIIVSSYAFNSYVARHPSQGYVPRSGHSWPLRRLPGASKPPEHCYGDALSWL